jgi:hypothetical protein
VYIYLFQNVIIKGENEGNKQTNNKYIISKKKKEKEKKI